MLSRQDLAEVAAIFSEAIELDPSGRVALLDARCGSRADLRAEVESLLAAHQQAESFMDTPVELAAQAVAADRAESLVGRTAGPYQILSQLGAGGMGEVYLAQDTRLGRKVALKLLPSYFTTDAERLRRFQQEASAVSRLNHPNILTIYEVGQVESTHYIATEHIDGLTLRAVMAQKPISLGDALDVALQVASALAAAHAAGIVHRDIKPENIMVRPDGYVKVLDFGLAKLISRDTPETAESVLKTEPGMVVGTPRYMSPEQARGLETDPRTDVWSLGVVLYEMAAGRPPFTGATSADVMAAILSREPEPLDRHVPKAPRALGEVVAKSLAKDVGGRFASAQELHKALTAVRTTLDSGAHAAAMQTAVPVQTPLMVSSIIDSLAVLPFANATGDADTEYLSDGITESLINSLSQIPRLRVVPRSSAFRYKAQNVDPKKVGRQLKVHALLMGKVLQRGDTLNVQAELVDVRQEPQQLWGERFHRKVTDIFTVEEAIAKQILEKLRLELTGRDKERLLKRQTENTEAYHFYLKGRHHWNKRTGEGLRKALEYFHRAVDEDPSYAMAYAGLADGYVVLSAFAPNPAKGFAARGKAAALKALEIDGELSEALNELGIIQWCLDWNAVDAERNLRRAVELKPDYWLAHTHYALLLSALGRHEEAVPEVRRGLEVEPLSLVVSHHVAWVLIRARMYDDAIAQIRTALELDPHFAMGYYWLGLACGLASRYDEAIPALLTAHQTVGSPFASLELARVYAASGRTADAQRMLADLHQIFNQDYAEPLGFAAVYAALGQADQAFHWLERGARDRTTFFALWVNGDPRLDSLRSDPRMNALLRHMGLEPAAE